MNVEVYNKQHITNFKNIPQSKREKYNAAISVCGGMMLLPLIPIIDGDSFKKTIKNRNAAKFITGMAAVGAGITGTHLLYKKFNDTQDNTTLNVLTCGLAAPLILFVDNWSQKSLKPLAKKWYAISAIAGGIVGFLTSKINNKQ